MMMVIRSGLCVVVRLPAKRTLGSFLGDENVYIIIWVVVTEKLGTCCLD